MTSSSLIIASARSGASITKTAKRYAGMMQGRQCCHWCQKHQPAGPGRRV